MSGLFITIWDENKVLKTTSGGYPHVTCFYSGDNISRSSLIEYAKENINDILNINRIKFTHSIINSFKYKGEMRHDVLLMMEENETIKRLRENAPGEIYPSVGFHSTLAICPNKLYAELINNALTFPIEAEVIGLTID